LKEKQPSFDLAIHEAYKLVASCVIGIDEPFEGNILVKKACISWKENSTIALIEHVVQRADENWVTVGDHVLLNLADRTYFVTDYSAKKMTSTSLSVPALVFKVTVPFAYHLRRRQVSFVPLSPLLWYLFNDRNPARTSSHLLRR